MQPTGTSEAQLREGKEIIGKLGELKYEMGHNAILMYVVLLDVMGSCSNAAGLSVMYSPIQSYT